MQEFQALAKCPKGFKNFLTTNYHQSRGFRDVPKNRKEAIII